MPHWFLYNKKLSVQGGGFLFFLYLVGGEEGLWNMFLKTMTPRALPAKNIYINKMYQLGWCCQL